MALIHGALVQQPARRSRRLLSRIVSGMTVAIAMSLLLAAVFLPVVQSSDATTTGATIHQNQQALADLQAKIHRTEASVAALGAMSRIQTESARLGMVQQTKPLTVSVNTPTTSDLTVPRQYLPPPAPPLSTTTKHGALWNVLHLVLRR
jgi:type II secretory pathway pseudopilin PulG